MLGISLCSFGHTTAGKLSVVEEQERQARPATRAEIAVLLGAWLGPSTLGLLLVAVSPVVHVHWLAVVGVGFVATVFVRRWVTFPLLMRWAARRSGVSEAPLVRWSSVVMGISLVVGIVVGLTNWFPGARGLGLAALGTCLVLTAASWLREKAPRTTGTKSRNESIE
jgi:hypothetical protein